MILSTIFSSMSVDKKEVANPPEALFSLFFLSFETQQNNPSNNLYIDCNLLHDFSRITSWQYSPGCCHGHKMGKHQDKWSIYLCNGHYDKELTRLLLTNPCINC